VTPSLWIDALVLMVGLAHALACRIYFAEDRPPPAAARRLPHISRAWRWAAGWIALALLTPLAARAVSPLAYSAFALAVAGWTAWWISLSPRGDKDWIDENRHQATGRIDGDRLEISNLRNFEWRGKRDWVERWESRSCDLSALRGVDMFLCTWGDPRIAHVMLSFDFEGGEPICFSVETRRERGERWTPYGGFMKAFELIVICGDERDLVGLRVRRKETVRLYRVYTTPDMRRRLLERLVALMNGLARAPRFYNTLFANCTIEIARLVREAGHPFPLDWRLIVSGHLDAFLYEQDLLASAIPFTQLRAGADVSAKAQDAVGDPDFSRRIREGAPRPADPA
jgi:hypothetical protein